MLPSSAMITKPESHWLPKQATLQMSTSWTDLSCSMRQDWKRGQVATGMGGSHWPFTTITWSSIFLMKLSFFSSSTVLRKWALPRMAFCSLPINHSLNSFFFGLSQFQTWYHYIPRGLVLDCLNAALGGCNYPNPHTPSSGSYYV